MSEEVINALASADADYLIKKGFDFLLPVVRRRENQATLPEAAPELIEHLNPHNTYDFWGIRRIVPIGPVLSHGTVIDFAEKTVPAELLESAVASEKDLTAFCPAGLAFGGKRKEEENARLFNMYKWYLADQLFIVGDRVTPGKAKITVCERLVLLKANGPDEALTLALTDVRAYENDFSSR